ncbi:MAG: hypothetical protein K2W97_07720 [Chthoniobacterales bacterium]|nr:hypothetical protein [Chthoniobacterales bacterium]
MKNILKFLLVLSAIVPFQALACEGCKMAASKGISEPQTIMAGMAFSWSVLFMLAAFFLLLVIFGWAMRTACLQADVVHLTKK